MVNGTHLSTSTSGRSRRGPRIAPGRRRPRWIPLVAAAVLTFVPLAVSVAVGGSVADAATTWQAPTELPSPTGHGSLTSVSCPDATHCTAIGEDPDNGTQLVSSEVDGIWNTVDDIDQAGPSYTGISCSDAIDCTAVGSDGYLTETDGTWGTFTAFTLTGIDGFPSSGSVSSIDCTSPGDCVAVGVAVVDGVYYTGSDTTYPPLYLTETNGVWGPPAAISLPSMDDTGRFTSISCIDTGDCTAVGTGVIDSAQHAVYATETDGSWGPLESNATSAYPTSVSCGDATDCTVVGQDTTTSPQEPMTITETAGTWGPMTDIVPPSGDGMFNGVSCSDATDCTAAGYDVIAKTGALVPMYATESAGTWAQPTGFDQGLDANTRAYFSGVSCVDADTCTAVGIMGDQAMYATSVDHVGLTPSAQPETGSVGTVLGDEATLSGLVDPVTRGSGAGRITFDLFRPDDPTCSGTPAYSQTVVASGGDGDYATSPGLEADVAGTWHWTASYSGDANGNPATSSACSVQPVDVRPPRATVALTPLSSLPGQSGPVGYAVSVTGSGPTPTGSVTIFDDQGASCVTSLEAGAGSCAINERAGASPYVVTASYSGDADNDQSSTSMTVSGGVSSGGSASSGTSGVAAAATGGTDGVDTLTESAYGSDPEGTLTDGNSYFDVSVSPGSTFSGVTVQDCDGVNAATQLSWWDPAADAGAGGWTEVVGDPGPTYASSPQPCLSVTLDADSSPSIAQLDGTVFATTAPTSLTITTAPLPDARPGVAYGPVTLQVVGEGASTSPYTTTLAWKKVTLPKGLKLSKVGVLSGTLSKSAIAGPSSVAVQVTETVTTLNGKKKIKTTTIAHSTIPLTVS